MYTVEHIVPKHWLPPELYNLNQNKAPAIRVFNNIKDDYFLCEWYEMRLQLCYKALFNWNLKKKDIDILRMGIRKFEQEEGHPFACDFCICYKIAPEYCIKNR